MGNEYRNHLKAMIPSLALYFYVLVMGFVVWNIIFKSLVYPYQCEYWHITEIDYSNVIESSNDYESFTRLKKLDNIITFTNSQGKRMNENVYVFNVMGLYEELDLREDEMAVSAKMAEKLDLSIGSVVVADYPIYDQPIKYSVKVILPFASDLYNSINNQDFSYVIVGDDGVLENQAKGTMVYFLSSNEYEEYLSDEYSYINKYDMSDEKESLERQLLIRWISVAAIMMIMVIAIAILMHIEINKEVLKYYYDGYAISAVKCFDIADHLIFFGVPVLLQIVYMCINKNVIYSDGFFICIVAMLVIGALITIFVGGHKYGKAA